MTPPALVVVIWSDPNPDEEAWDARSPCLKEERVFQESIRF
jgi:hypothetical protein